MPSTAGSTGARCNASTTGLIPPCFKRPMKIGFAPGVAVSVLASAIYDFLKDRLKKPQEYEIVEMPLPDGRWRLVVRPIEE